MSGETLALETQLLLQEVTQAASQFAVAVDGDGGDAAPVSELEAAKRALVDKLRQKKDKNKQQQQKLLQQRYGFAGKTLEATPEDKGAGASASAASRATPTKAKRMVRLPVVASSAVGPKQKKDLLAKLRTQAIHQGAQSMAKLFGYSSYEEQIKHLNKIEKLKILQSEQAEADAKNKKPEVSGDGKEEDSSSDFVPEAEEGIEQEDQAEEEAEQVDEEEEAVKASEKADDADEAMDDAPVATVPEPETDQYEETQDLDALIAAQNSSTTARSARETSSPSHAVPRRRRNRVAVDEDNDGNEADSEQDGDEEEDGMDAEEEDTETQKTPRDKAAAFRQLLQAEAKQERRRKRLRQGENFVESEADEDEEEDVLKIGGLGDFGFGVPQATSKESKEAEEERNALKMREDDLEGIVDDLSDDERAQEQDLEEIYRRELEEADRQQLKEVMRNVKEGFGRNRRAFSNLDGGLGARGRFNLNELVAADGDKLEAARLGLLESDEEMNEDDDEEGGDAKKKDVEAEDEDEEAEMERMLRERFLNQPKIYITSSESESEGENKVENDDDEAAKEEIESDEERERQQMKLFSERARINRRMQRMKDMQRQIAQEVEEESAEKAALPNLLLEEDEESQELLKVLTRTDIKKTPAESAPASTQTKPTLPTSSRSKTIGGARPKVNRFNSFGMGSSIRSTSSFSRVADNCKLFSAGSGATSASKGFVFTSFSSDKADQVDENVAPGTEDTEMVGAAPKSSSSLSKGKSWGGSASRPGKRPFAASNNGLAPGGKKTKKSKSDFFSVLASYQCVSQNTASEPM